ncbi:MAG: hypothetical protein M3552_16770 [Planctomycetota bacterium]|nr:hypothetical protein [Planctomycetaceae bacterium]MDQ3332276.1 hypothetical protein [Planctomycetota bacterium]
MAGRIRRCNTLRTAGRRSAALLITFGTLTGSAAAQTPENLKWWNDDGSAGSTSVESSRTAGRAASATVRTADPAARRSGSGPSSAEAGKAGLRWWETRQEANELNWWKAKRDAKTLGWWNQGDAGVSQASAQQSPFGRKDERQPPAEQPLPQAPLDGRTPGAEGIDFDPFSVVPPLKPLTQIQVTLAAAPPADSIAGNDEPVFTGTAEEYFATKGGVFLAPRSWPRRTPEAAAYQFYSRPLWFEDANVERCGETVGCLQPVVSGTYFFANTLLLPYRFAAEPQCEAVPQKPFCPPGCRYTHAQNYLPPWSPAGVAAEAAAVTGLVFLIP